MVRSIHTNRPPPAAQNRPAETQHSRTATPHPTVPELVKGVAEGRLRVGLSGVRPAVSPGQGEVVHGGDGWDGVVEAVSFLAAVAVDLQFFMRVKVCSTRARTRRVRRCPPPGRPGGRPARLRCGTAGAR